MADAPGLVEDDGWLAVPEATLRRSVFGMFCEDIREEKDGRLSLMGVLPDSAQLGGSFPLVLDRIIVVAWVRQPIRQLFGPMLLGLEIGGLSLRAMSLPAPARGKPQPGSTRRVATAILRMGNLEVPAAGTLRAWLVIGGRRWRVAQLRCVPEEPSPAAAS
jgi:hypothetical protein